MFLYILFFSLYLVDSKQIRNINVPSCRNCIHYKPEIFNEFSSLYSKCDYFGSKNINTDYISYDYANMVRENENKCGIEGKYFEQRENIEMKIILHNIISNNPYISINFLVLVYFIEFLYDHYNKIDY